MAHGGLLHLQFARGGAHASELSHPIEDLQSIQIENAHK